MSRASPSPASDAGPDRSGWETRHLARGRVTHIVGAAGLRPIRGVALCGTGPAWWDDWRGTGTQEEYDRDAGLPLCARCAARAAGPS